MAVVLILACSGAALAQDDTAGAPPPGAYFPPSPTPEDAPATPQVTPSPQPDPATGVDPYAGTQTALAVMSLTALAIEAGSAVKCQVIDDPQGSAILMVALRQYQSQGIFPDEDSQYKIKKTYRDTFQNVTSCQYWLDNPQDVQDIRAAAVADTNLIFSGMP